MNPNVRILPIKIGCDHSGHPDSCDISDDDIADAIIYAYQNGADVLSNSWNYRYPWEWGRAVVTDALNSAFVSGRGGLGCPIIFSAGNWGRTNACLKYPARLPCCFSVGAIDLDDNRWDYSSYGGDYWYPGRDTLLDVVAPSEAGGLWAPQDSVFGSVWTLDQMDTLGLNRDDSFRKDVDPEWYCGPPGHNNNNYNCMAGGTSMACPIVSGVASLLLSKDSTLTAQEIYEILRYSAVTELESGTITPPDYELGYGRVDAFRAILSISRGDIDNTNQIDISDPLYFVEWYFNHQLPEPFPSPLLADCTCDGEVDISDLLYLVEYMFNFGPPPVKPCFEF